jgi:single-strand DNA-binding protein
VWNSARGSGLADVVEKYVKKGEKVYVEGEIEYRQWQDKEGQTRYTTEIKVKELMLLGGRQGGGMGDDMDAAPRRQAAPSAPRKAAAPAAGGDDFNDFPGALEDEDDDLPF